MHYHAGKGEAIGIRGRGVGEGVIQISRLLMKEIAKEVHHIQ